MNIESLQFNTVPDLTTREPIKTTNSFSHYLHGLNQKLNNSEQALQSLAKGEVDNLHQVMIQMEQAKLSLQLLEQARTRALSAYQDLMKEQI